jgi:hypothetical protein
MKHAHYFRYNVILNFVIFRYNSTVLNLINLLVDFLLLVK